ncbi:hypothetical protein BDV98DRAFT_592433 [Pterulicium gracile]|uniref:SH3 domain-containing protein n=1 Tax=Pterulicium gracile TaxID=1884261 RepID=A0A5C3QJ14_9AGAR|nr:hypothetical protein BDV98DRAFT_592433 [Pterula gracilis]
MSDMHSHANPQSHITCIHPPTGTSSTSSPDSESIDPNPVYALHSLAATVPGQASVVQGDSLILMDGKNSHWWLVRVVKTQQVGYIPAKNVETPLERLARLKEGKSGDEP